MLKRPVPSLPLSVVSGSLLHMVSSRVAEFFTWSLRAPKSQISRRPEAEAAGLLKARPGIALSFPPHSVGQSSSGTDESECSRGLHRQSAAEWILLGLNLGTTCCVTLGKYLDLSEA